MLDIYIPDRWTDVADILLVAAMIWAAFLWLRRTRSRLAVVGLLFLSAIYLLARQLELQLTIWILQFFFAVLAIVLVVIFQEDLRRMFEQIAVWGLRRQKPEPSFDAIDILVRAVARLARTRTGALLVLPGREPLDRHLEGGIELGARLSEPLLLSLFDHHSPGHDGAVIVEGMRVLRFATHLPLSTRHEKIAGGTRHAASLGLAERCDALVIVVSEERGTVTVAREGEARRLDSVDLLSGEIRRFLEETASGGATAGGGWSLRRWLEPLGALGVATLLWALLVPGSGIVESSRIVPVTVENLPAGYRLVEINPPQVTVLLNGPRRLIRDDPNAYRVRIDALLVELGRRTFQLTPAQVELPPGLIAVSVQPERVRLEVEREAAAAPVTSGPS